MSQPITLIGTVATEPRSLTTQAGLPLCSFRLACNERRYHRDRNEWSDGETNWFTVTAFRGLALGARESLHKGDRVMVHGRLRIRTWERDGRSGTTAEVEVEALGHDLRFGSTHFARRQSPAGDTTPVAHDDAPPLEHEGHSDHAEASGEADIESEERRGADGFLPAVASGTAAVR